MTEPNLDDIIKAGLRYYAEKINESRQESEAYIRRLQDEQRRRDLEPGWHTRYVGTDHDAVDYYIPCDHRGNCGCENQD